MSIATVDQEFRFRRANKRFCDLLGYSEEELMEMGIRDITHPDDLAQNIDLAEKAFRDEIGSYAIEMRYVRKSGGSVWVHLTATYVRDDAGRVIRGLVMVEDITERKRSEARIQTLNEELEDRVAELEEANAELEHVNKELETFSAQVSYDLKGPLVSIAQFSQILLNRDAGTLEDAQDDLLRRIRNAGHQARHIIDDLRDLADVTRRELFAEEVDISAMLTGVIEDLRFVAPERDVRFKVRADLRAYADPALVRLLLVNLVQNAWKYTGRRDIAVIEVGLEKGQVRDVFFVKDNGIGFDPVHRDRIFEAFHRLHTDVEFAGTGLGLATARRIVRCHGGDIWADGTEGEGATFSFTL